MKPFLKLTVAGLRSFTRDRTALIWSLFFPIFFILIFGSIFNREGKDNGPHFSVRVVFEDGQPVPQITQAFSRTRVLEPKTTDLATARADLEKGDARAVVVFPAGIVGRIINKEASEVKVYTDPAQQINTTVAGIVHQVLAGIDKQLSAAPTLIVTKDSTFPSKDGEPEEKPAGGINFLLPGILAMTVMQLGLFTAIPLILMREKGILKRLRATPLPRGTIVGSQVAQRLAIAVFQTFLIIAIGVEMFKFRMIGSWPALFGVIVFGVLTFISIGAVLASIAKTQESGVSMVQLTNFPMMFLSGLFFPVEILPKFFLPVVKILPATYMADLLRHIMTGASLTHDLLTSLGVMAAWLLGALFIAAKTFRWE